LELISQLEDMSHEQTTTGAGSISEPLTKPIKRIVNRWKTTKYPRLSMALLLTSFAIIFLSPIWLFRPSSPTAEPTTPPPGLTPQTDLPPTSIPTVSTGVSTLSIPITGRPPLCIQYPQNQAGWNTDYKSGNSITLEKLYRDTYGQPRNFLDIYAIAYYNNRKVLENKSTYNSINPVKLSIDKNQTIFLPPKAWIDQYRDFPRPILENIRDNPRSAVRISGSSVLDALSFQIEKCFEETNRNYDISLESKSTAAGLYDYCQGNADIIAASEEITAKLMDENGCSGINLHKFEVASDSIVIFINENNPYAEDIRESPLNRNELVQLLFTAASWHDIRDKWGTEPINRDYPSTKGGSFEIVKNELYSNWSVSDEIPNLVTFEKDSDYSAVGGVINDLYAIGFSRYEPYRLNNMRLIALPIDNVLPNPETIQGESPTYPLTRTLYLYTGETKFNENPLLRYFVNFFLTYELDYLDELGYLYPSQENFLSIKYYPRPK
jgi:ABC-type phosphate transport system substrate-binding protein